MNKRTVKSTMAVLILLVISLYFIAHTYAKYTGTASGIGEVQVAKWNISVAGAHNNQDMTLEFKQVENAHVVDGRVAPNTRMYADLEINPEGTEVSIDYTFKIGSVQAVEGGAVPEGLKIEKVCYLNEMADGDNLSQKSDGTYYGSILLPGNAEEPLKRTDGKKVRVYAIWENDPANDANDSEIARKTKDTATPKYKVEITAHAEQHIE